jgi:hypothetical protein
MRSKLAQAMGPVALAALLLATAGCGRESAASPSTVAELESSARLEAADGNGQAAEESPLASAAVGPSGEPPTDPAAEATVANGHPPPADRAPILSHDALALAPEAPQPGPAAGKRPAADRTPRRPGEPERITFEDLFLNMPADVVFRPFMLSERARELDGERVSLVGYMHGGVEATRGIKEFILLRNTECKFGPGGQADHLAQVVLRTGNTTEFDRKSVKVEGTLKIEPFQGVDGNTWSIYRLEDAVLK